MNEDDLIALAQAWRMQIDYYKMCLRQDEFYPVFDYSHYSHIFNNLQYAEYNFNETMRVLLQVVSPEILTAAKNLVRLRLGF